MTSTVAAAAAVLVDDCVVCTCKVTSYSFSLSPATAVLDTVTPVLVS